jgi:hypothetical protein
MPRKDLATLSVSTFLFLVSHGVVAATTAAVFFGTGFRLLSHPWEEMGATRSKPTAATADRPASADATAATADRPASADATAATADRPAPADATAPTADRPAPADATAPTADRPAPADATAPTGDQPAPADATAATADQPAPNAVPRVDPHLIAALARAAADKGITLEQYRDARLRYLREQQAQIELQLTEPTLSATKMKRLERQKAYWGRAIEQTMAVP